MTFTRPKSKYNPYESESEPVPSIEDMEKRLRALEQDPIIRLAASNYNPGTNSHLADINYNKLQVT